MPKNKGKGGKGFRKGKKGNHVQIERELVIAREEQGYAKVLKNLGDCRMMVELTDGKEVIAIIPGSFRRRKVMITTGDLVLIGYRSFQKDKVDILYRYNNGEISKLIHIEEVPDSMYDIKDMDDNVVFDNEDDEEKGEEKEIDLDDL